MKVLVSGSHGLIGHALVTDLERAGHHAVRLVRPSSPHRGKPAVRAGGAPTPATVAWEPARNEIDHDALAAAGPFDAVVHVAGAGLADRRWSTARRQELLDSRVLSTRLLVDALRRLDRPPGVVVSGSAIGYYGDRGSTLLDEDSAPGAGFLAHLCQAWEAEAAAAADLSRVVWVRTGVVLARDGGALARQLPLFRLGLGGRLGDGRQYTSWISLRDEVAVIRRALDDDRLAGPVNATAPHPVTNAELTAALGRALHRPAVLAVPCPALDLALGPDLVAEAVLASQRVVPARLEAAGHRFADPDIGPALAGILGRHP